MRKFTKKNIATVVVGAVAISGVGVAYAAWTSTGSGTGTAKSTTSELTSSVAQGVTASDLYPGAKKSVTISVTNNEDFPVSVTHIPAVESAVVNTACAAASVFTLPVGTAGGTTAITPATGNTIIQPGEASTYTVQTRMIGDANEACKNQSFTLSYTGADKVELLSAATTPTD